MAKRIEKLEHLVGQTLHHPATDTMIHEVSECYLNPCWNNPNHFPGLHGRAVLMVRYDGGGYDLPADECVVVEWGVDARGSTTETTTPVLEWSGVHKRTEQWDANSARWTSTPFFVFHVTNQHPDGEHYFATQQGADHYARRRGGIVFGVDRETGQWNKIEKAVN